MGWLTPQSDEPASMAAKREAPQKAFRVKEDPAPSPVVKLEGRHAQRSVLDVPRSSGRSLISTDTEEPPSRSWWSGSANLDTYEEKSSRAFRRQSEEPASPKETRSSISTDYFDSSPVTESEPTKRGRGRRFVAEGTVWFDDERETSAQSARRALSHSDGSATQSNPAPFFILIAGVVVGGMWLNSASHPSHHMTSAQRAHLHRLHLRQAHERALQAEMRAAGITMPVTGD
jgi:hypothetical protein